MTDHVSTNTDPPSSPPLPVIQDKSSSNNNQDNNNTVDKTSTIPGNNNKEFHVCEITITFPTNQQAEQAKQILQVDTEPTDRVTKAFSLLQSNETTRLVVYVIFVLLGCVF